MLKRWRIAFVLVAMAMLGVLISACGSNPGGTTATTPTSTTGSTSANNCVSGNLRTGGSTALAPLVQAISKTYAGQCSGANITTQATGSGAGLAGVSNGSLDVGNSDVFASASQYPGLVDHQVAIVVFAVIVSPDITGVTNLTSQQLTQIYTGKITNWKQVGGPDEAIAVISRPASSGTRKTFQQFIMNGTVESVSGPNHSTASTSGEVATRVQQTKGAISYDTLHFAQVKSLKTINIDGAAPNADDAVNNSYKFWNIEHMYTKGEASGLAKAFIDYVSGTSSAAARQSLGFVDISKATSDILATRQPKS